MLVIAHGTHKGEFMGIAPTAMTVTFSGINIYTIAHGRFIQSHVNWDMLTVFSQIGAVSVRFHAPPKGA